jgi:Tfp pilus assembly protein PilE
VSAARSEHGFTLIELLVAMSCAIVIIFALVGIMIVAMHQSQRTFTRVSASRQARTALARVENELHSACVNGSAPIQGITSGGTTESDGNDLVFVSYFGPSSTPQAAWHVITYSATAHTLVDTSYGATYVSDSTGGHWTPTGTGTPYTLLSNARPIGSTPVFQYFRYASAVSGTNRYWWVPDGVTPNPLTGATTAQSLAMPLGTGTGDSANTVEVEISLLVGPSSERLNNQALTSAVGDQVNDIVSLRLTTPPDYTTSGQTTTAYGPCE